jgi:hypothetical protein
VLVGRGPSGSPLTVSRADVVRAVVTLARAPATAGAVRQRFAKLGREPFHSQDEIVRSLNAHGDPISGVVRIDALANTAPLAQELADIIASETTYAAQRLVLDPGALRLVVGDFEDTAVDWQVPSAFNLQPTRMEIRSGGARFNSDYLHVSCRAAPGCGPATRVTYPFQRSSTWVGTAWVRSRQPGVRLSVVLGASPRDYAAGRSVVLTRRWRRIGVTWIPRQTESSAEVTLQSTRRRAVIFDVDGVLLSAPGVPGGGTPSQATETRAFRAIPFARALPARPIGTVTVSSTLVGALVGGGAGLLAALIGVAAGRLARRSREQ